MLGDGLTTENTESTERLGIPNDPSVVWFLTLCNSVNSVVNFGRWANHREHREHGEIRNPQRSIRRLVFNSVQLRELRGECWAMG
jgi:hypothetical protein